MSGITIRRMVDADRETVIDLLWQLNKAEAALTDTRSELREDAVECLAHNEKLVANLGGAHVIAERDGVVIGYMCLAIDDAPPFVKRQWRRHLRVMELVVTEACRGQGIGRQLLREADGFARAHGLEHILIGLVTGNAPADHLYANSGYDHYGIERLKRLV